MILPLMTSLEQLLFTPSCSIPNLWIIRKHNFTKKCPRGIIPRRCSPSPQGAIYITNSHSRYEPKRCSGRAKTGSPRRVTTTAGCKGGKHVRNTVLHILISVNLALAKEHTIRSYVLGNTADVFHFLYFCI